MNTKKILTTFVGVYVVAMVLNFLIHGVLLEPYYMSPEMSGIMRPEAEMESNMWIHFVTTLFFSFFFVFIFSKGYESKGIMEGVRYGVYVGLMVGIPMAYDSYAVYPMPYGLVLQWFLYTLVGYIILGVVAAALYKPKAATPAA